MKRILSLLLCATLIGGCAHGSGRSHRQARVENPSFWTQKEIKTGQQIHQQITSTYRAYTEPRAAGYVTRIGRTLTRVSGRKEFPYLFTILYDDRLYATSAPGGFVYITTGFLSFLENEAELAAVLAHEVAEIQFRDPKLDFSRRAVRTAAAVGAIAAPFFGPLGVLISGGLVALTAVAEARTPTPDQHVVKADQKALHYMVDAGQDPQGYLDLMSRLVNTNAYWSPYLYDYSTARPITAERYQAMMEEFHKLSLQDQSFSVHRDRYLLMTKGVREIYQR